MAIYKLPLDDELDADIIDWIASFPRNKKSEVVRHALRYYMNESKEKEQVFIVSPMSTKIESATVSVEKDIPLEESPVVEEISKPIEGKIVLGGERAPKTVKKKGNRNHSLLDEGNDLNNSIPDINPLNLR